MTLSARPVTVTRPRANDAAGFSLSELLVSSTIMLVVLGATMGAMMSAVRANQLATMVTAMNSSLRTGMDLMVRDLLQTGQDLPVGRVVSIPSGGSTQVKLPGPPGSLLLLPLGTSELSAVMPGPGLGPSVNGVATDMVTFLAADTSFSNMDLTALTNTSITVALPAAGINGMDISNGGPDDVLPGQLIMLTKGSLSTLVQVTTVNGSQTANFASGDSLALNQTGATVGTLAALNAAAPATSAALTQVTRIRMISYYIDATTTPNRPRLVRRMNNGHPTSYNNALGTVVAFDIENLQITFDITDGVVNPTNVKMTAADRLATGPCEPNACSPNQIRKVNIVLGGRSNGRLQQSEQFVRNTLSSQVSLRSLSFVDKYTTSP